MKNLKPYTIDSVGQFLSKLEDNVDINNSDWFYRGENQDFGDTKLTATLYRGHKLSKNSFKYNTWKSYLNAMRSYYQNLSVIKKGDKDNFMALCQHHAIPTPLLDVSMSPLVALYFASQEPNTKYGRVYVFNKSYFIPYNNKILSYNYLLKCYRNNYEFPLFINSNKGIKEIYNSIKEFIMNANKIQDTYIIKLITSSIQGLINYLQGIKDSVNNNSSIIEIIHELKENDTSSDLQAYLSSKMNGLYSYHPKKISDSYVNFLHIFGITKKVTSMKKSSRIDIQYRNKQGKFISYDVLITDTKMLLFLIYLGNQCRLKVTNEYLKTRLFIPRGFNFYTACTFNWGRIRAQKSKFIIQMPFILNDNKINHTKTYGPHKDVVNISSGYLIHKPIPHCVFKIKNKEKIRKQLNILGINKMNLFMDRDSIADYIKHRYYSF